MPDQAFLARLAAVLAPGLGALAAEPGRRVLDLGCGQVDLTRALARRCPGSALAARRRRPRAPLRSA